MKITNVYTEKYKWPKAKPIANGTHVFTDNELNLLVVETDEGITGYGCSWEINFAERMGKAIIGEDPLNNERLWRKTYVPKFMGRKGNSCGPYPPLTLRCGILKPKWRECLFTG